MVATSVAAIAVMATGRWSVRTRGVLAAVLLGVGFCLKLYPGLFVLPLALYVLTRNRARDDLDVRGAAAVGRRRGGDGGGDQPAVRGARLHGLARVLLVPATARGRPHQQQHLVLGPASADGRRRSGERVVPRSRRHAVPVGARAGFALALWLGWRRYGREGVYPWIGVSASMLCAFVLLHKVHSPQYTLWLLPFLVLLRIPGRWSARTWSPTPCSESRCSAGSTPSRRTRTRRSHGSSSSWACGVRPHCWWCSSCCSRGYRCAATRRDPGAHDTGRPRPGTSGHRDDGALAVNRGSAPRRHPCDALDPVTVPPAHRGLRRLAAPAAVPPPAFAVCGFVVRANPTVPVGPIPTCPTQALLGLDCPLCGSSRMLYALLHFDVPARCGTTPSGSPPRSCSWSHTWCGCSDRCVGAAARARDGPAGYPSPSVRPSRCGSGQESSVRTVSPDCGSERPEGHSLPRVDRFLDRSRWHLGPQPRRQPSRRCVLGLIEDATRGVVDESEPHEVVGRAVDLP